MVKDSVVDEGMRKEVGKLSKERLIKGRSKMKVSFCDCASQISNFLSCRLFQMISLSSIDRKFVHPHKFKTYLLMGT